MASITRCGNCKTVLAEPSDTPTERRIPCPACGSTVRSFEKNLTATVVASADVVVVGTPAEARAEGVVPGAVRIDQLEDAGFDVQWLRLSDSGPWMVRVFDRQGNFVDGSVQESSQDAILAVCERLLPPSGL
jgi:DNA-directed RNA polymerase subunit RPC12/RpoP